MSTDAKMKTCKECKAEKCVDEFAMSRRIGEKIYYRGVCKVCWGEKQKNKYIKKNNNGLNRRGNIVENKPELLTKIVEMRYDGEEWSEIANVCNVSHTHLNLLCRTGVIPVK